MQLPLYTLIRFTSSQRVPITLTKQTILLIIQKRCPLFSHYSQQNMVPIILLEIICQGLVWYFELPFRS